MAEQPQIDANAIRVLITGFGVSVRAIVMQMSLNPFILAILSLQREPSLDRCESSAQHDVLLPTSAAQS